jgi:hypothetical protein
MMDEETCEVGSTIVTLTKNHTICMDAIVTMIILVTFAVVTIPLSTMVSVVNMPTLIKMVCFRYGYHGYLG